MQTNKIWDAPSVLGLVQEKNIIILSNQSGTRQTVFLQPTCAVEVCVTEGKPHSKRHWHLQDCKSGSATATFRCFSVTRKKTEDFKQSEISVFLLQQLAKVSHMPHSRRVSEVWISGGHVHLTVWGSSCFKAAQVVKTALKGEI